MASPLAILLIPRRLAAAGDYVQTWVIADLLAPSKK
jgi:hypothetical protein